MHADGGRQMTGPAKLRRDVGVIGLLYASLGSIIGSGWLFGALHAAVLAGPWSVFSWMIGAAAILLLASYLPNWRPCSRIRARWCT
jgi:amino acid transporter